MSAPPPLSVLLPVRDGEAHLLEALDSLRDQSFPDFELLVVDDGSSDGTREILLDRAEGDPRLRVFEQEPRGIVAALELVRSRARGRFLARMDADDRAHPDRLRLQMDAAQADGGPVALGTGVSYFPRSGLTEGSLRYEAWINGVVTPAEVEREIFVECPLPHPSLLVRADLLAFVGGYRERGWPEDYDLILRLWGAGARLGNVPGPLLEWRVGEGRLSRTHPAYSEESFRRCKVHHLLRSHLFPDREVVVWGAGPVGKTFARELQAQGGRVRAFVDLDPRKIGQVVHGAPVIPPEAVDSHRDAFCVAAVGQLGAREEIREALTRAEWVETRDFVAVA